MAAMAMAMLASVAVAACAQNCADGGSCAVPADHSLLQAKIHVHHADEPVLHDNRDCPEFGICGTDEDGKKARLAGLVERAEKRRKAGSSYEPTRVAWDCGSSGSNMMVTDMSPACSHAMTMDGVDPRQELGGFPTGGGGVEVKNHAEKYNGVEQDYKDCTVSMAFGGATAEPVLSCAPLWERLATWINTGHRAQCFGGKEDAYTTVVTTGVDAGSYKFEGSICWAAGTAGNRLQLKATDLKGWENFQAWTIAKGICGSWAEAVFPSYVGTLTIPGTVEASMEVESLHSKLAPGSVKAFGSAGGSSAQFGICLSCASNPKGAEKAWTALIEKWGTQFQAANFPSQVDSIPQDYLNTYKTRITNTYTKAETWGVGSFLGTDKCKTQEQITKASNPVTPMGGMSAMGCGLGLALNGKAVEKATASELVSAMQSSGQGAFAKDFAKFIQDNFFGMINTVGHVRFVAKVFAVKGGHTLKLDKSTNTYVHNPNAKFGAGKTEFDLSKRISPSSGEYDAFTAKAYAYMKTLGLLPAYPDLDENEQLAAEQKFLEQTMRKDGGEEYAWLDTASSIGFTGNKGKFLWGSPTSA